MVTYSRYAIGARCLTPWADPMMTGDAAELARAFHPRASIGGNEQGES